MDTDVRQLIADLMAKDEPTFTDQRAESFITALKARGYLIVKWPPALEPLMLSVFHEEYE